MILAIAVFACVNATAQTQPAVKTTEATTDRQVFAYVEEMPTPGFDINKYLADNLHYPPEARKKDIEGKVMVKFVVNEDGTLSDYTVMRGIGGGCDEEAVRLVKGMPRWKPGRQNGRAVATYFALPVIFSLTN